MAQPRPKRVLLLLPIVALACGPSANERLRQEVDRLEDDVAQLRVALREANSVLEDVSWEISQAKSVEGIEPCADLEDAVYSITDVEPSAGALNCVLPRRQFVDIPRVR